MFIILITVFFFLSEVDTASLLRSSDEPNDSFDGGEFVIDLFDTTS